MADKAITDLNVVPGSIDDGNTWFAVAQSGAAYKVSGHQFVLAMASIWESHGGIRDIVYTEPVAPSLTGTLTITLADDTEVSFDVENGKGITSITKTGTVDLVDTYTITYNDGTTTSFTVTNGEKGDTGDAWYVWIRYAGEEPTQDSDIGTDPDNWMGVYSGTSSTAPVHYTDYDWFQIKGAKGDTGDAATIVSQSVSYQQGDSPNIQPSGTWLPTIPAVAQGKYLWTKTDITFNSGSPITFFSVARMGVDGAGSVSSVNGQSPDGNGNVTVTANDIQTTDSTSVQSDLTGLKNTLNSVSINAKKTLVGKRAYIIGDSLNSRNGGFGQYVLSISGMVGQSVGNGASGFVQQGLENKVFADVLSDLVSSLTADEKNSTDYLIVLGGINDALNDITAANEKNAVASFITSAKLAFPNAEIIICPLHTFKWLSRTQYNCYAAIMDASSENGVRTTEDFMWWTIVDDYGINDGDNVHITSAGCQILGGLVVNYLLGGDVLRTWSYSATSSIGTVFSNSLTRRGRDFFWRGVVTSLSTATPTDLNRAVIISCSNQAIANAVWTSGALFINGFVYGSSILYPIGAGIAKTVNGLVATCYVIPSSDLPQSISNFSAWIEGVWKAGVDEYPNS